MKEFAERLRTIITTKGITQAELAEDLQIAPGTLSSYINDKKNPRINEVVKYARILGVPVWWLLGEDDFINHLFPLGTGKYSVICSILAQLAEIKAGKNSFKICVSDNEFSLSTASFPIVSFFKDFDKLSDAVKDGVMSRDDLFAILRNRTSFFDADEMGDPHDREKE